jgi:hypothetical protein
MERTDAVIELLSYDHCFIDPESALTISRAFGFDCRCYTEQCDYKAPKGLQFADGRKEAYGIAAEVLAKQVCHHLNIEYPHMMGRGFQLRVCCDAIDLYLKTHTQGLPT